LKTSDLLTSFAIAPRSPRFSLGVTSTVSLPPYPGRSGEISGRDARTAMTDRAAVNDGALDVVAEQPVRGLSFE
jgi:hypothetical protein